MKRLFKRLLLFVFWPLLILGVCGIVADLTHTDFSNIASTLDGILPGLYQLTCDVIKSRYVLTAIGAVGVLWCNF